MLLNMSIDYDHALNPHTVEGARVALGILFSNHTPSSLLDVGCGTGTWLKAASDMGVSEVYGVDGIVQRSKKLLIPEERFRQQDLTHAWNLGRRFEYALCLEVAEHLDACHAPVLIDSLTAHADTIYFSAACPNQLGQHHVNCQWPSHWQGLFNERGYVCSDAPRWQIWNDPRIEPWYRQNLFVATRQSTAVPFEEPRILSVVHPAMVDIVRSQESSEAAIIKRIENGIRPARWYLTASVSALRAKVRQALGGRLRNREG